MTVMHFERKFAGGSALCGRGRRKGEQSFGKLPMEETMNLEGIVSGDKLCLQWEIEDLSIHLIHSRKLNIKAVVTFYAA